MTFENEEKVRKSFAAQTMMATLGAKLTHIAKGKNEIQAPILPGCRQQHGVAHDGLTFAIGDSAAGYAALSIMPHDHEVMTTEMKIHLLAPGQGDLLIARGRVIKPGRRLVIVQADVYSRTGSDEVHVAMMTGTMIPLPAK